MNVKAHLALLESLECHTLLTPPKMAPITEQILSNRQMQTLIVPDLQSWLEPGDIPTYPFNKTQDEARNEPFVCLHTSGSTGLPKPVILRHGTIAHHDLFMRMPELGGRALNLSITSGSRIFFGLPMFHSAGLCFLVYAIYSGTTIVFAPDWPVTAEMANDAHVKGRVEGSFLSPNTLNELVLKPGFLENISRLQYLTFGGASLPREVGSKLKGLTHLFVSFGATETGFYALEETGPEDWEYARFSSLMGIELRRFASGLYELHFIRQERLQDFQGIFATFPDLIEYSPKDLYSKHPSKEGLWLYEGRSDDVIVSSLGTNYNPLNMEGALQAHPSINAALVCGENRPTISLIVEARDPPGTENSQSQLLQKLWPFIEETNSGAPAYARIYQDLVIFTTANKPMVRAGKGTVLRKKTAELYGRELEVAYRAHSAVSSSSLLETAI